MPFQPPIENLKNQRSVNNVKHHSFLNFLRIFFATGVGRVTTDHQTTPEGHSHRTHPRPHDPEHLQPLKEAVPAFVPGDVAAEAVVGGVSRPNILVAAPTPWPTPTPTGGAWESTWWMENRRGTRVRTGSTTR